MQKPRRLVCIVEGKGEVQAIPNLCARILASLSAHQWFVDKEPVRRPRSQLVDERVKGPRRPCREEGVRKALEIAAARHPDAILVMCDSDDDCPGRWASSVASLVDQSSSRPAAAVMAVREFEAWLLWGHSDAELAKIKASDPDRIRNAKGKLEKLVAGYEPTTHQLLLTRQIDVHRLRQRSRSFDKLVRTLGLLCRIPVPPRPS
jgi:hypothetical protein